jgi:heme/copper-type cytochrome/quinol oxidase subunit 2
MMVLMVLLFGTLGAMAGPRVIQITADEDGKFKVPGQKKPMITLKAQEVVVLRITSHKGSDWEKDGAVHSFTINALKDQGWDLRLKEGTKDFTVSAPAEPGEYVVECTVRCGKAHDDMKMKLIVTP